MNPTKHNTIAWFIVQYFWAVGYNIAVLEQYTHTTPQSITWPSPINSIVGAYAFPGFVLQIYIIYTGTMLYMHPANERRHYSVTTSLIGWAHTQNDPCLLTYSVAKTHVLSPRVSLHIIWNKWQYVYTSYMDVTVDKSVWFTQITNLITRSQWIKLDEYLRFISERKHRYSAFLFLGYFVNENMSLSFIFVIVLVKCMIKQINNYIHAGRTSSEIIWCMRPYNERRCYTVTSAPIGWAYTQNNPCIFSIHSVNLDTLMFLLYLSWLS